jgi:predicted dehydrogenase
MANPPSSVSRRGFLGSGAAGAFTIVSPGAVRGSQANSKVTFGLIGVGGRGSFDAGIVHSDPRARVTALCDLFDDRIEEGKQKIKVENPAVFNDYEKLLASDVDAVIIATPPFKHPEHLAAAVQARKHVFCEKPMGVDVEGCRKAIATSKKVAPGKCVSVGFQQRYGPVYLDAYDRLKNGEIGPLATARGYWISNDPFQKKPYDAKVEKLRNWFCYRDYSGDFIVEQDCHNFDVLHWFLGGLPVRAVGYAGRKVRTTMDLLDHLSLAFEWPDGMHVNFEANQLTPRGYSKVGEEFTGTKGTLLTSRASMTIVRGINDSETRKSPRDITIDAFENFIGRILSGDVENVLERSALSTVIAILGRTALYTGREATWKGVFGA